MKNLAQHVALAALVAAGASAATAAPASAAVGITFGFDSPRYYGEYNYSRPCSFYRHQNLPAPARCYRDYYQSYGRVVFLRGGFVFRDRDDFGRWRDRDDSHRHHDHDRDWHNDRGDRHDPDGDRGGDHDDRGRDHDHDRR